MTGLGAPASLPLSLFACPQRATRPPGRAARLVASELVSRRGTPPGAIYSFKHALVQDAAHGSLLRSSRQQLHAHIAEALEAHSPELMETQPELFAQHYAEAELVEKSVVCWGKAAICILPPPRRCPPTPTRRGLMARSKRERRRP